jgi:site-specific DNA-adenine methylase
MKRILMLVALLLQLPFVCAQENGARQEFFELRIDNLVVNAHGLTDASRNLSLAIERLSQAFEKISENDQSFTEEEKQALLSSARAVERASIAIENLSNEMPQLTEDLTTRLPQMIEQSRASIADISGGLHSASVSVTNIVEHLPQATENTKQLVEAALDSALVRLSIFVVIALLALALVLIVVLRYTFKTYVEPLVNLMAPLKDAPEHFDNLSRQMERTSDNMLRLEQMKGGRWFKPPP